MAESESGSGNWLMTYGDFMTLLMIFFIVLYSFTPGVDREKFQAIVGAFKSGKGVLKHQSVVSPDVPNLRERRSKSWHKLKEMIKDKNLRKQVQIEMLPSGARITLGEAVTFKTYSAKLIPQSFQILKLIGGIIEGYKDEPLKTIEVFGHTDNRPVIENARKYPNNWSLGAARAISVVQYLMEHTTLASKYFEAATFGKFHPRTTNDTKEGRRQNRRVEIDVRYEDVSIPAEDLSSSPAISGQKNIKQ